MTTQGNTQVAASTTITQPNTTSTSSSTTSPAFTSASVLIALINVMNESQKLQIDITKNGILEANRTLKLGLKAADLKACASYVQGGFSIGAGLVNLYGATQGLKQIRQARNAPEVGQAGNRNVENRGIEIARDDNVHDQGLEIRRDRAPGAGNDAGQVEQDGARPVENKENAFRKASMTAQKWQAASQIIDGVGRIVSAPITKFAEQAQATAGRVEKAEQSNRSLLDGINGVMQGAVSAAITASQVKTSGAPR
jgi:hypothetical protein